MDSSHCQLPSKLYLFLGHGLAPSFVCPFLYSVIFGFIYQRCGAPVWPQLLSSSICEPVWAWNLILLIAIPIVHLICIGPTVWIKNTVSVRVDAPLAVCSQFIRDARNLAQYEQKVEGCSVIPGGFTIWGSWFGLPYSKSFDMIPKQDGGFHSIVKKANFEDGLPMLFRFLGSGGFRTLLDNDAAPISVIVKSASPPDRSEDDSAGEPPGKVRRTQSEVSVQPTKMVHYESYGWPVSFPFMPVLAIAWRVWHRRGMEVELELIKTQIEHIFKVVRESSVGMESLGPESLFAADYPPMDGKGWNDWKYGANDFINEAFAKALCRPYRSHHPCVGSSSWNVAR